MQQAKSGFSLSLSMVLAVLFIIMNSSAYAAEHPQLKAFPAAEQGMTRFVINLPHKERGEEDAFKVEIVAGKTMLTDGVNKMRLGATISPKPLKGWGYTFYQVEGSDAVMSTMMAPPEGAEKVSRFVAGSPLQIRYNSRIPVVIYAKKGFEVRYRIWKADASFVKAQKN